MEPGYGFCEDSDFDAELTAAWMVGGLHRFLEAAWAYEYSEVDALARWKWLQGKSQRYLTDVSKKVKRHIADRGYDVDKFTPKYEELGMKA